MAVAIENIKRTKFDIGAQGKKILNWHAGKKILNLTKRYGILVSTIRTAGVDYPLSDFRSIQNGENRCFRFETPARLL